MKIHAYAVRLIVLGILTAMVCYGCGSSSGYLSMFPSADEEGLASVSVDVVGTNNAWRMTAKAFYERDDLTGTVEAEGTDLYDYVLMGCSFDSPTITGAAIGVAESVSGCADPRNCCVFAYSMEVGDDCGIAIDCLVESDLSGLGTATLDLSYWVSQAMRTNQNESEGTVSTIIDTSAFDIFDLTAADKFLDSCTDSANEFQLSDDNPWLSYEIPGYADATTATNLRNTDSIGAVNINETLGYATCTVYYNVTGSISLAPLASDTDISESGTISGAGQICNSTGPTDCDVPTLYP